MFTKPHSLFNTSHTFAAMMPAMLASFEWGWLTIFVACAFIATGFSAIILLTVWLTGGFSGRN
jgi:hypothetical protein